MGIFEEENKNKGEEINESPSSFPFLLKLNVNFDSYFKNLD